MEIWQDTTSPLLYGEVWRDVPGFEGYYQASNLGRVKSLDRYLQYPKYKRFFEGKILKQYQGDKKCYLSCPPLFRDGKIVRNRPHRIIAMTFLPNPLGLNQVNHINGCKWDNRIENLEWCTSQQNMAHAYRTGLVDNRLKIYEYDTLGNYVKEWSSLSDAARFYGITPGCVVANAKGNVHFCAGRIFRYHKADKIAVPKRKYKRVAQLDGCGNILRIFENAHGASEFLGCKYNTVVASICHKRKIKGYIFNYI